MNTVIVGGNNSGSTGWLEPGFSTDGVSGYLFKKGLLRANTSLEQKYYQEPLVKPRVYREYFASDKIPDEPPTDFATLTPSQISDQFGITEAEVTSMGAATTSGGLPSFTVEQSAAYPYLYRISNCLLIPYPSNPVQAFTAITPTTKVNLLASTIPFTYGTGNYRGKIYRTDGTGTLTNNGLDQVLSQQLAFIFDYDAGIFTMYNVDSTQYTTTPIDATKPPAITCYVYRGNFGRLGWSVINDSIVMDETRLLVGTKEATDPTLVMDVSGNAFITDLQVHSLTTTSDIRKKRDITHAEVPKGVLGLVPRYYNYIDDPADSPRDFGLIAQEVEATLPEIVRTSAEGFKSVAYDRLGAALLPFVKEHDERLAALEKENAELKHALVTLMEKLG
jgi:hypothetical protein